MENIESVKYLVEAGSGVNVRDKVWGVMGGGV